MARRDRKDKESENLITFDAYFKKLLKAGKVLPHHKLPMKSYAQQMTNLSTATEQEFERIFSTY